MLLSPSPNAGLIPWPAQEVGALGSHRGFSIGHRKGCADLVNENYTTSLRPGCLRTKFADGGSGRQPVTCSRNCGRSSVIVNHGALELTKMCAFGRILGSSINVPRATWT